MPASTYIGRARRARAADFYEGAFGAAALALAAVLAAAAGGDPVDRLDAGGGRRGGCGRAMEPALASAHRRLRAPPAAGGDARRRGLRCDRRRRKRRRAGVRPRPAARRAGGAGARQHRRHGRAFAQRAAFGRAPISDAARGASICGSPAGSPGPSTASPRRSCLATASRSWSWPPRGPRPSRRSPRCWPSSRRCASSRCRSPTWCSPTSPRRRRRGDEAGWRAMRGAWTTRALAIALIYGNLGFAAIPKLHLRSLEGQPVMFARGGGMVAVRGRARLSDAAHPAGDAHALPRIWR